MSERMRETEVVLIGIGAAGGIAAQVLTAAGIEVVALEAGPRLDPKPFLLDEVRNDVRSYMSRPKSTGELPSWRFDASEKAGASPYPLLMVNAVGGTSVHYDCWSFRFQPWNFRGRSASIERYGAGSIPAGSTIADWPLSYEELAPAYDAVEYAIGIAGAACNIDGVRGDEGNWFEAPRSRGFPMPPQRMTGWNEMIAGAARRLGWHPYQSPVALNTQPYNGNGVCTYCGFCASGTCPQNAKSSTNLTTIPIAEATGLLRIETGARVTRIEVGVDGRVTGVTYIQDGTERFQPAKVVLLGAFVYENARLLLPSKSRAYPDGLSNNHGQVGKHYMLHMTPHAYGLFPGRRLNRFNGAPGQVLSLDDWNADNFDHSGLGFIGGAMLSSMHELKPIQVTSLPLPPGVPRWGAGWKDWIAKNANSIGTVNAQMEVLAYEHNVLDLDPEKRDPYGEPVIRITHKLGENEQRGWAFMEARLQEWLREAGASEVWTRGRVHLDGRHAYGGTRMGNDPETSVVDKWGFSHEAPNLGVIGSSVYPTTGGCNPTLTLQALAWRTAEHLVADWKTRAG
jgi:gluconate 2-dehydrogenase alpha chain